MADQTEVLNLEEWVRRRLSDAAKASVSIAARSELPPEIRSSFNEAQIALVNKILAHAHTMHAIETADFKVKLHLANAKLHLARQVMGPKARELFDFIGSGMLKPWWGDEAGKLSGEERAEMLLKSLQSLSLPMEAKDLD